MGLDSWGNFFSVFSNAAFNVANRKWQRGRNPISCPTHASLVTAITSQQDSLAGAPEPSWRARSDLKHILSLLPPHISLGFTREKRHPNFTHCKHKWARSHSEVCRPLWLALQPPYQQYNLQHDTRVQASARGGIKTCQELKFEILVSQCPCLFESSVRYDVFLFECSNMHLRLIKWFATIHFKLKSWNSS